jgi:uncharacterized membrane protein YccC
MDTEQQAERARAILRDLSEPFAAIRERHMQAFASSDLNDDEARRRARYLIEALNELEAEIATAIGTEAIQARKVRKRNGD